MSLKIKLIISSIFVIFTIIIFAIYFTSSGMDKLMKYNSETTNKGITKLVKENIKNSTDVLTKAGERIVQLRSEVAANKIKILLLKYSPNKYDIENIKDISGLYEAATKIISIPGYDNIEAGYLDLIKIDGTMIFHPNKKIMGKNVFLWEKKYPEMCKIVKKSFTNDHVEGYYTFIDLNNKPVKKFMALTRIKGTPFVLCASVKISAYFNTVVTSIKDKAEQHVVNFKEQMDVDTNIALNTIMKNQIIAGLIIALLAILFAVLQANNIVKPILRLCEKSVKLGKGDFSFQIPEKGGKEIAILAKSFNTLIKELKKYVTNLKMEIEARKLMEGEIKITREIQNSLLPHKFPAFPDKKEFAIFADLRPAKEVSGDFYDFFMIDEETLIVTVADVSGKGLPASLFMAVTRTLLRTLCLNNQYNLSVGEILSQANKYLCRDNDSCMFVTTFIGFYNIKTGTLLYSNAGHNPVISRSKSNLIKEFGILSNIPLGVIDDYSFDTNEYKLSIDETLFLYTDGITEAPNENNEEFGIERFKAKITEFKYDDSLKNIANSINDDLVIFQGEIPFDDITILMLKRNS